MSDQNKPKRTRRTPAQMREARGDNHQTRTTEQTKRQQNRQRNRKPLKLDVTGVQERLEEEHGKPIKMKWVRHQAIPSHQQISWNVVNSDMKSQVNAYSPDGRVKAKGENIQDASGGAFTAAVGNGEHHFLMWKDLEAYEAEDAVWNKEDADRPMDSLVNSAAAGERAGLGGDVETYQPKQMTKIEEKSELIT